MIVILNKIYILSAPKESEGMTPDKEDFLESTITNGTVVNFKKISTSENEIKSYAKVFSYKDLVLQVVIFIDDLPEKLAKKRINEAVARYLKNAKNKNK